MCTSHRESVVKNRHTNQKHSIPSGSFKRDVGGIFRVKLYNPDSRRKQKYLTGKYPHSQNTLFFAVFFSLYLMLMFSIYSTETPRGLSAAARRWLFSCVRTECQASARSSALGQLEATLISFADPGGHVH